MDKPFEIERTLFLLHRLAIKRELDNIVAGNQLWSQRACQKETVRFFRMTYADVPVGIDNVLVGEDAVSDNEIVQQSVQMSHHSSPRPLGQRIRRWVGMNGRPDLAGAQSGDD